MGFVELTIRIRSKCVRTFAGLVVSLLCWINFSNAAAFESVVEQCLVLNVTGSAQPIVNGLYRLDKSFGMHCNSHPVWTKTSTSLTSTQPGDNVTHVYIYYQDDGFDGWIISNTSCYTWGNFIAGIASDPVMPYSVDTGGRTWQESVTGTTKWTHNPRITVTCDSFAPKSDTPSIDLTMAIFVVVVIFVFVVVAALIITFVVARRHRYKDKQVTATVAVSDPGFRYKRVLTQHDDASRHHVTGTGNEHSA